MLRFLYIILVLLTVTIAIVSCSKKPVKSLISSQVRKYQGEKLSSITEFRENSINGPQKIDINNYTLKITGLINSSRQYTYDEIINNFANYKKIITLDCVEGWKVKILWQGVLVQDLIKPVKPKPEAKIIIFKAYDGYTTSFPIDYIMKNDIIMAYKMNDITLPFERGFPFQLVAESKWGYKWIKWITEIELSSDTTYQGYWESRGYSNDGDLNKNFFER